QAAHPLPAVEDFFQKEKGRRYSVDGPFSLLFNTLSDRLVGNDPAFLFLRVLISAIYVYF
ncbi:hypothetical protein N9219_03645, partial [bacterium]|nr:hypothetical protein [bacterium]